MNFSLVYLIHQFFFRIFCFVRDWYAGSFIRIWRFTLNSLEALDRVLAWRITFRNIFEPLYGDYSVIGHILGFVFRLIRFLIGTIIYPIIIIIAVTVYVIWIFVPIYIIYTGFNQY